jgi:hypothetical protein
MLACALRKKNAQPSLSGRYDLISVMGGHRDDTSAPPPARAKRASAKKSNVAKARVSSPNGVAHAEALALAAQPLEPAEVQRPVLALAPVRRSPTNAHSSFRPLAAARSCQRVPNTRL